MFMQKNEFMNASSQQTKGTRTLLGIKEILRSSEDLLKTKYRVRSLAIFGSYARGDQQATSDVDLLVEFEKPIGGFAFIELADQLEELLGMKVDLLTPEMIRKNLLLKKSIEEDLIHV
jgi:predicted nucleotidyltransferase